MAVKLLNVPYQSYLGKIGTKKEQNVHDFVYELPEFFIKNPKDYGKFMRALKQGGLAVVLRIGAFINPTNRLHSFEKSIWNAGRSHSISTITVLRLTNLVQLP